MIRVMMIDDEKPALEELEYRLKKYDAIEIISMLQNACQAMDKIREIEPDVVFLDIDMPGYNGLELANKMKEYNDKIIIIFVTAYSQYALEAFQSYPLDYILKPVSERRLAETMEQVFKRFKASRLTETDEKPSTFIRCFNNFEAYTYNGIKTDVKFSTRQTKELFAYLLCNFEKQVTRKELIEQIFGGIEDKKTINLLHVTAYNLRRAMEEAGIDTNSISIKGYYTLMAAEGVCDYIEFSKFMQKNLVIDKDNIEKAEMVAKLYNGLYLNEEDYLWAVEVRTRLELWYEKLLINIAEYYKDTKQFHNYEKTLITLVNYDSFHEEGNCALLAFYLEKGRQDKFIEHYKNYEKVMKDELQAALPRKALKYFEFLKKKKNS